MYNPNVPSSNMGIAPISGQPSQPMGPAPMAPPPPMMAPPPMAPPIAPITEGLGGFGGSSSSRAGFSERMQKMTAPSKPKPMPQQMQQPVQGMQFGGMVHGMFPRIPSFGQLTGRMPYLPQRGVSNPALLSKSGGGIDQYGEYLNSEYGDPDFDQKRDSFLQEVSQKEQQTFGGGGNMGGGMGGIGSFAPQVMKQPFMGGALQRGFSSYGIPRPGGFNSSPFGGGGMGGIVQRDPIIKHVGYYKDGGEVPRDVSPVEMALGGFAGNPTTRDYNYTDPYEELDDLYDDIGGYDPTDPFGDGDPNYGGGGGDDDGDFNPPIPIPAPPVVVPDPKSGGDGDDIKDRIMAEAAKQIAGARSDIQLSDGTVLSESDLNPVVGADGNVENLENIRSLIGDNMVNQYNQAGRIIDAIDAAPVVRDRSRKGDPSGRGEVDVLEVNPINLSSSGVAKPAPNDIQLEMASPTDGGLAGASTRPGMGSDDPIVYNDTPSGPVFTNPDGTVLTPADSATINAQARLDANPPTGFDTMALEEEAYPSAFSDDMQLLPAPPAGEDIQNPPKTLRQATGRAPMTSEEAAMNVSGIDSAGNVVSLAGASGYDSPAAAANRANASSQPVPVPDSAKYYDKSDYESPGVLDDYVDPYEDQSVKDSYSDQLFGDPPKTVQLLGSALKFLSSGLIDINKLNKNQRKKGLEAFAQTNQLAYENGVVVGVKDPKGKTIYLGPQSPKDEDNIGGGEDGCPPGFRRVNGVCQPINGVSPNPADDIADDIERGTIPIIRPIIRPLDPPTGDVTTDPVTDEPSGIDFRRPNYFAGGGAVSEGMGSAIDNFISAMSR